MGTTSTDSEELLEHLLLLNVVMFDGDDDGDDDADADADDTDDDADGDDGDDDDTDDSDEEDGDDVEALKAKLADNDKYIVKLKKENAKWRRRYRASANGSGSKDDGNDDTDSADKGEAAKLNDENRNLKLKLGMSDALGEHSFQKGAKALAQAMVLDAIDSEDDLEEALEDIPSILEDVLKEHPYLLKTEDTSNDKDDDEGDDKPTSGRSASKRKKGSGTQSDEELYKKFPALRRR